MERKFKACLVGCGAISANHVNGILAAGGELIALCDIDATRAEALAERFSLKVNIYTDYIGMLDTERPDSVHICTPHYLHADMVTAALSRGVNVLCEKPLAINRTELERVLAAEAASDAQLGVCLQNRYEPTIKKLRELAGERPVGALGVVNWRRDADYYDSGDWRGKWLTEGGGVMINQAIHTLDLLRWIAGEPESVIAHISNDHLKNEIEVEDTASALFLTADGRRINLFATNAGGANIPAQVHIRTASGDKLYADNSTVIKNGTSVPVEDSGADRIGKAVWGKGHALLISDFYSHLVHGEHFPIDAAEGGRVIRLVLSMYESNGKSTKIY